MKATAFLPPRILDKINFTTDCWLWTASKFNGYGKVWHDNGMRRAHRVVYELLVGEIPDEHDINQTCKNRACVKPEHLDPVTREITNYRGHVNKYKGATHCVHGHEFTKENTAYHGAGKRRCKQCRREQKI